MASPNQGPETVAGAFVGHWILRFGCPLKLHSNQGSNFYAKNFPWGTLGSELEVDRTSTTSYHPQGKTIFRRTISTIEKSLSKYQGQYQHEQTDFRLLTMIAYQCSVHSLSDTANRMLYRASLAHQRPRYVSHQVSTFPTKRQEAHWFMRDFIDVEQELQKIK